MEKKCTKCGKVKDVGEFHKSNCMKDGLRYNCKQCRQQYQMENKEKISKSRKIYRENNKEIIALKRKQQYQLNKEAILKKQKQYYQDNKEKISERSKCYYGVNKGTIVETVRQYAIKNKEKISEHGKQYRLKNREDISEQKRQHYHSNAIYEFFFNKLTVDELPILSDDGISLEVRCRYCGKYFIPSFGSANNRVRALNGELHGDNYLYCSENCKQACPIYGQVKYPKGFKVASSREVNSLIRQMVFERDNWTCQICGRTSKEVQLHCHHMDPVAQNPMFQNDIDSCITLCKDCHKMVHKQHGCRYVDLRCKNHQMNKQIPEIKLSG